MLMLWRKTPSNFVELVNDSALHGYWIGKFDVDGWCVVSELLLLLLMLKVVDLGR